MYPLAGMQKRLGETRTVDFSGQGTEAEIQEVSASVLLDDPSMIAGYYSMYLVIYG